MIFVAVLDINLYCFSALYPELATLDFERQKFQYLTVGGMTITY